MVQSSHVIEIEVDSSANDCLKFSPLNRRIRGTFDFHRVKEPLAAHHYNAWPKPIPGQRLRLNTATGEGLLIEPLRFEENQVIRAKVEKTGSRIAAETESLGIVDQATWLYWMRRAVDAGFARVTSGDLPTLDQIKGKPRKNFHGPLRSEGAEQNLTQAVASLAEATKLQTALLAEIAKSLKAN